MTFRHTYPNTGAGQEQGQGQRKGPLAWRDRAPFRIPGHRLSHRHQHTDHSWAPASIPADQHRRCNPTAPHCREPWRSLEEPTRLGFWPTTLQLVHEQGPRVVFPIPVIPRRSREAISQGPAGPSPGAPETEARAQRTSRPSGGSVERLLVHVPLILPGVTVSH